MENSLFLNSEILLIGIGNYESKSLDNLPSAHDNVIQLKRIFQSKELGIKNDHIHTIIDCKEKTELLKKIKKISTSSKVENLIVYYAGHGVLSADDELFLTVNSSTIDDITIDGIEISDFSKCLGSKNVIYILDCCFSERAFQKINQRNYLAIASTSRNSTSKYSKSEQYSVFTKELIDIMQYGLANGKETIKLYEVYIELKNRLLKKGSPEPKISGTNSIQEIIAFNNNFGITTKNPNSIQIIPNLDSITEEINNSLVTSSLNNSLSPRTISEIFVPPPLFNQPEEKHYAYENVREEYKKSDEINIEQIINSDDNYIIFGKKESGKTTLLLYISNEIIQNRTNFFPCYLDFQTLNPNKPNTIDQELRKFLEIKPEQLKTIIQNKNCNIFIDNLDFYDKDRLNIIKKFISENIDLKYIISCNQNFSDDLETNDFQCLNIPLIKINIHSFRRKEVHLLTEKWFQHSGKTKKEVAKIKDQLYKILLLTKIPSFPINISFLLWIFETSRSINKVINKASLIEEFVETVLEKFSNLQHETINDSVVDYRTKQHFLSHLVEDMTLQNVYTYQYNDLVTFTSTFFKRVGNSKVNINKFIQYLIAKGILIEKDNNYLFKFKCIAEYFISRRMMEDQSFYNFIVNKERYLSFFNEIDYLTALMRNNKNLLDFLLVRVKENFQNFPDIESIPLESFESFSSESDRMGIADEKTLLNLLNERNNLLNIEKKDTQEEYEDLIQMIQLPNSKDQEIQKNFQNSQQHKNLFESIRLFSIVLKNCEFLPTETKVDSLIRCLDYWGRLTIKFIQTTEQELTKENLLNIVSEMKSKINLKNDISKIKELINNSHEEIVEIAKITTPLFVQSILLSDLGTDKLEHCLIHENLKDSPFIVKFFSISLYSDLQLPDSIELLESLFRESPKEDFIIKIFYIKLMTLYISSIDLSEHKLRRLENLIIDIHVDYLIKVNSQKEKNIYKNRILQKLKKQRIINKHTS